MDALTFPVSTRKAPKTNLRTRCKISCCGMTGPFHDSVFALREGDHMSVGAALGDLRLMFSLSDPALHGTQVESERAALTIGLSKCFRSSHGLIGRRVLHAPGRMSGRLQMLPGLLHRQRSVDE